MSALSEATGVKDGKLRLQEIEQGSHYQIAIGSPGLRAAALVASISRSSSKLL